MSYAHNQKYNPHKSKNSSKISHKMTPVCQATWKHYVLAFVLLMVIDTLWIQLYFLKPYTAMIEEIQNQIMEVRPACFVAAYTAMLVGLFGVVIPNIDYSDMSTLRKYFLIRTS